MRFPTSFYMSTYFFARSLGGATVSVLVILPKIGSDPAEDDGIFKGDKIS
jgi:hypothetical protein